MITGKEEKNCALPVFTTERQKSLKANFTALTRAGQVTEI
jgi:hypothetical protein